MSDTKAVAKTSQWYRTGFSATPPEPKNGAGGGGGAAWPPSRLWIPPGQKKSFIFVDDTVFGFWEHNPKINGDWRNYITCLQQAGQECPACEIMKPQKGYYAGFYTIIDCSEWLDKKGNKHQFELKLLFCKSKTLKKLQRKKEERGSLVGLKFNAHREDERSPSCGDEFEFDRAVEMDKMVQVANFWGQPISDLFTKANTQPDLMEKVRRNFDVTLTKAKTITPTLAPFNYMELFKPKSPDEIKAMLVNFVPEAPDGRTETATVVEENVPF